MLPRSSKEAQMHLFARRVQHHEDLAVTQILLDWDWLRVDDALAELGVVASTTAREPTTRTGVTSRRRRSSALSS